MSTSKDFAEYVLDGVGSDEARVRRMFGEYAIYFDDVTVGFICDNNLFLKILPSTEKVLNGNDHGPAYPGSKDYFIVTEDQIETRGFLKNLFEQMTAEIPKKKLKGGK